MGKQLLTETHLEAIRERIAAGATQKQAAIEFGVNPATIGRRLGTRGPRKDRVLSQGGPPPLQIPGGFRPPPAAHIPAPPPPVDYLKPEVFDEAAIVRELIDRGGLREFITHFWSTVEPGPFVDNWHIGAICEYLEAVTAGQIKRLVINIPPACMKSLTVSVFWPAWDWTLIPADRFLCASFDQSLVLRDAGRMISILTSELYTAAYPEVELTSKTPALGNFTNTSGGLRFSTTPEGKATGRHAHKVIIDDPMKPQDAINNRKSAFDKINTWFEGTLPTRAVDPQTFAITLIMQRVHADDLAGKAMAAGYETLILPMRRTKRALWARDPRTERGELLWPSRYPEETVLALERTLRTEASAQLQQDPTPATGGFVEEPWTRLEWIEPPPAIGATWVQSWDFSAKGEKTSHSKISGQLWCRVTRRGGAPGIMVHRYISDLGDRLAKVKGAENDRMVIRLPEAGVWYFLVDFVGGHWNFVTSKAQFTMAQGRPMWKLARRKLVEAKANGIPLIEEMKSVLQGIVAVEPEGDKEERLRAHTEKWELNQVIYCPGSDAVREEHVKFPRFTWDDHVDTSTQALDFLANSKHRYRENLAAAAQRAGAG